MQFRDQLIAAPLKLSGPVRKIRRDGVIPRSADRGPIEAIPGASRIFLSTQFRDQLIAAPLKQTTH